MDLDLARKLVLVLEYEGTRYHGFQSQANASSIQDEVESALYRLTGERIRIKAAGRTDAGVHAAGQVVAFETQVPYHPDTFREGLNHYLPPDISVRAVHLVPMEFNPRRHAIKRTYRYTILNRRAPSPLWRRFAHHEPYPLDVEAMGRALKLLEGKRDFASFSGPSGQRRSTVRHLFRTQVSQDGELITLEVEGDSFLPQQVRRMAAAVTEVGRARITLQEFGKLANCSRLGAATRVLDPQGLCLVRVKYREFWTEEDATNTQL